MGISWLAWVKRGKVLIATTWRPIFSWLDSIDFFGGIKYLHLYSMNSWGKYYCNTPITQRWRSLRDCMLNDEKMARSRVPIKHHGLSMIFQWSPQSPQSFDLVQNNLSTIAEGSNLSTVSQWAPNEGSTDGTFFGLSFINLCLSHLISQRSLSIISLDITVICQVFQWVLNKCLINTMVCPRSL